MFYRGNFDCYSNRVARVGVGAMCDDAMCSVVLGEFSAGWEFDLSIFLSSIFRSFQSLEKIDRDRIDHVDL